MARLVSAAVADEDQQQDGEVSSGTVRQPVRAGELPN